MGRDFHLEEGDFAALLAERVPIDGLEPVHLHLLECPRCRASFFDYDEEGAKLYVDRYHGAGSAQSWLTALKRPALETPPFDWTSGLAADEVLQDWSPRAWPLRMASDPRFQSADVLMFLLTRARRWWQDSPQKAEYAATAVVWILEAAHWLPESLRTKLLARAWAYRANAYRIQDRFDAAHDGFTKANHWYARAAGNKTLAGEILWLRGTLYSAERRFDLATRSLESAISLLPASNGLTTKLDSLISLANTYGQAGRLDESIEILERLVRTFSPTDFPEGLHLPTLQNLAFGYVQLGRIMEAKRSLPEIQRLARREGKRLSLLRVDWLGAEISKAGLVNRIFNANCCHGGPQGLAPATRLQEVRAGFLAEGLSIDAALAGLSLAELYLELEDSDAAADLAMELIPVFRSKKYHREARVAELIAVEAG